MCQAIQHHISNREYWQAQVSDWQTSGLTAASWCREQSVNYSKFIYWRQQLTKSVAPNQFCEVGLDSADADSRITVKIGAIEIQIQSDFDELTLLRVVNVLGRVS